MEYLFGKKEHEADILDFANFVFSQAHRPHDFKRLLPKVYAQEGFAPMHALAVDENKRIRGMAALLEGKMLFKGESLSYGYVGTVSVHPYSRGEGHMKKIMPMLKEKAEKKGLDFLVLSGNRQRYRYFGFENALSEMSFSITKDNIRHELSELDDAYSFENMQAKDESFVKDLYFSLENRGAVIFDRRDFLNTLKSWDRLPYIIYKGNERIGYTIGDNSWNIFEAVLYDNSLLLAVIKAWHRKAGSPNSFSFVPSDYEQRAMVGALAQSYSIRHSQMINVLSFERLLLFVLSYNLKLKPCFDFKLSVSFAGERLNIEVNNGKISVCKADSEPEIVLSHDEAVRMLFEPYSDKSKLPNGLKALLPFEMPFPSADSF